MNFKLETLSNSYGIVIPDDWHFRVHLYKNADEKLKWLQSNCKNYKLNEFCDELYLTLSVNFFDKSEAMLFKLMFGENL